MKGYKFRLQTLLKIREQEEEMYKSRLGSVMAQRNGLNETLGNLREQETAAIGQMSEARVGKIQLNEVKYLNRYVAGLAITRQQAQLDLGAVDKEIERRRRALLKATTNRKVLSTLRAKQLLRHKEEMLKAEQKELDEVAQNIMRRNSRSN